MSPVSIVSRHEQPDAFSSWESSAAFASGARHPIYGGFGRSYYPAVYGAACRDMSFAVLCDAEPVLLVCCNILTGMLGYFGMPMIFVWSEQAAPSDRAAALSSALTALDGVAKAGDAGTTLLRDEAAGATLSDLGRACLGREAAAEVKLHGVCDLTLDEVQLRRHLRKSYQSLINWGRRNLRMAYINAATPDRRLYDAYREFHGRIAGRVTRGPESWEATYQWIVAGGGELALAYLADGSLVAATVTVDGSDVTYYASGVYDRERFDRPLAHWPLFDSILRSRARGRRRFDLGELPARGAVDDKEFNIGYFKRGFATAIEMQLIWRWNVRNSTENAVGPT